jgi:short-subunit dehydrogenase
MTGGETWIVLGASSAIGRAYARALARPDVRLILAGRDMEDLRATAADLRIASGARVEIASFDAVDFPSHAALAQTWAGAVGPLNIVLVFGLMPEQVAIDSDPNLARACIDATFTGAVSVLHHLAPHLEKRKTGTIIGIGSVAGDRGRLKNYVYGSAKAGLHTYFAGMRNRLARSGVHVLTVKPGFVDTAMTWGLSGLFLVASPDLVARKSLAAAAKGRNVCYVPGFWRLIMLIIKAIPEWIFKRLSI